MNVHAKFAGLQEELTEAFGVSSEEIKAEIHHIEHHEAHLASSFLVSRFEEAKALSFTSFRTSASA
jgi:carbamoyltransferase